MRSTWGVFVVLLLASSQVGCSTHSGAGAGAGAGAGGGTRGSGGVVGTGGTAGKGVAGGGGAAVTGTGGMVSGGMEAGTGGAAGSGGAAVDTAGSAGGTAVGASGDTGGASTTIGSGGSSGGGGTAIDGRGTAIGLGGNAPDPGIDAASSADRDVPSVDVGVSIAPDYLIVAADGLAVSAQRYRDFRQAAGFNVDLAMLGDIVGDAADASSAGARILDHVRARYQARDSHRPMYLLLLGDAQATWPGDHSGVPAGTWHATASSSSVVSDNVFADMDGDDVPDIAVGRITADSDAEVDLVRAKVAAYETTHEIGTWDRRLNIFASTSGLGAIADVAIENLVYAITEAIPYDDDVAMTYARQTSPYVYIPEQFSDQVYRLINEGSLLVAYVGHGSQDGFASLDWNGTSFPILDTGHLEKIAVTHRSPILVFVACSTGAFAGAECVSERILAQANAPTAILSSTEISDPYANAIFIYEVSQAFTSSRAPTVGEAFLQAKQRMLSNSDSVRQQIDSLAGLLVGASARDELKHSHLHMYTLFGDPGMAVAYPGVAQVTASPSSARAGATLAVTAAFPALGAAAEAVVTLESARKVITHAIATVPGDGDSTRDTVIANNYHAANDKVVADITVPVAGASLSTQLTVPANVPAGQYHIKVFVQDGNHEYVGSAPVTVN